MEESKIFITNYPRTKQRVSFVQVGNERKTIDIISGYDINIIAVR